MNFEEVIAFVKTIYRPEDQNISELIEAMYQKGIPPILCIKTLVTEVNFSLADANQVIKDSGLWVDEVKASDKFTDRFAGEIE